MTSDARVHNLVDGNAYYTYVLLSKTKIPTL